MAKLVLDEADGLLEVEIRLAGQEAPATATLDLFASNNHYVALKHKHGDDFEALGEEWVGWLAARGLAAADGRPINHALGFRVFDAVADRIAEVKKNAP